MGLIKKNAERPKRHQYSYHGNSYGWSAQASKGTLRRANEKPSIQGWTPLKRGNPPRTKRR